MIDFEVEQEGDRLIITLDPGQPIELDDFSKSFAALARMYERHYRKGDGDDAPRLYVTRLQTGSVIMEIAPYGIMMGGLAMMDGGLIVTEFTSRVWRTIRYFAGGADTTKVEQPTREDAQDIREFTKPLLGKNGASLVLRHAKFEKGTDEKKTVIEYNFDEAELNRAALNIDDTLGGSPAKSQQDDHGKINPEVMLFLEQANRGPGKENGRTGDKGIIPDISEKALPVYFRQSIQGIKETMLRGQENPFAMVFVVDVHASIIDNEPRAYTITAIHDSFPRDEA